MTAVERRAALRRAAGAERRLIEREARAERRLAKARDRLARAEERLAEAQARVDRRRARVSAAEATLGRRQAERATGPTDGAAPASEPVETLPAAAAPAAWAEPGEDGNPAKTDVSEPARAADRT